MKNKHTGVEEYKERLKIQCTYNGTGYCVGCGISPEAFEQAITKAKEEGYKEGHADALRTIPVYESNNITPKE